MSFSYKEERNVSGMVILTKQIIDNVFLNSNSYRNILSIQNNNRAFVWEKLSLVFQCQYRSLK